MATAQGVPKNDPIVFTLTNTEPDTRLKVFDQEFLVYSLTLRLHSDFFRTFLDSADKSDIISSSPYRYDWGTLVDNDGTWSLVCADKLKMTTRQMKANLKSYRANDQRRQETVFMKFLCALFMRPYRIENFEDLCLLAEFGDYYRSLPVISNSLYAVIPQDPEFVAIIKEKAAEIIPIATQLRNSALFKECIIHLLGPWHQPRYLLLEDEELKTLASTAYAKLAVKISEAEAMFRCRMHKDYSKPRIRELRDKAEDEAFVNSGRGYVSLPLYYRNLYNRLSSDKSMRDSVAPLVENNLIYGGSGYSSGVAQYRDFFLCAKIENEDLPWDTAEFDW